MKKTVSVLLACIMLVSSLIVYPLYANADGYDVQELFSVIYDGLASHSDKIDISGFNIKHTSNSLKEISSIYQEVFYSQPLFFYVSPSLSVQFYSNGNYYYLIPSYYYNKSETEKMLDEIYLEIKSAFDDMPRLDRLNDFQKILTVHDYICANFCYDDSLEIADIYNMLKYGKGVCNAYTMLFMLFMDQLGIESSYVKSTKMDHIWNVVKLNGNWYNVDVTWDDLDPAGLAQHTNFMKSNSVFISDNASVPNIHYGAINFYDCSDTSYDDFGSTTGFSPILYMYEDECWYMEYSKGITNLFCVKGGQKTVKKTLNGYWYDYASDKISFSTSLSGIAVYGTSIYFNDQHHIYRYNRATDKVTVFYNAEKIKGNINGLKINDGILTFTVTTESGAGQDNPFDAASSVTASYQLTLTNPCKDGHTLFYNEKTPIHHSVMCSECHDYWITEHNITPSVIVTPTKYSNGKRGCVCPDCGLEYGTEAIPALSSSNGYTSKVITEPTFKTQGIEEWYHPEYGTFEVIMPLKGDIDNNGVLTITDYIAVKECILKIRSEDDRYDINGDGVITFDDYISLRLAILEIN